ncbi:MAG TPA: hypothetical protein VF469_03585 [Kofleriaceae bacterium]
MRMVATGMAAATSDATLTFFPVGNGDTSLIKLADGATLLIDLCQTIGGGGGGDGDPAPYDVHGHLLRELRRDELGRPHLDVFVATHPGPDHLRGVEDTLYLGAPGKYAGKHRNAGLVIVDELWFAPRVFDPHQGELGPGAKAFRKEARRRIARFRASRTKRLAPGDRIRIIGDTGDPALDRLTRLVVPPGTAVASFNHVDRDDFALLVHAPSRRTGDRDDTSIVVQARFRVGDDPRAGLAMFGGDAGCAIWEDIIDHNHADSAALEWDLLLAPAHCSWTFFSEGPWQDDEPSEKILALLGKRRAGALVIASGRRLTDSDDTPPHHAAAERYREHVGADGLLCTANEGTNEGRIEGTDQAPEPIYVRITELGPQKDRYSGSSEVRSSAAREATIMTPKTYGA